MSEWSIIIGSNSHNIHTDIETATALRQDIGALISEVERLKETVINRESLVRYHSGITNNLQFHSADVKAKIAALKAELAEAQLLEEHGRGHIELNQDLIRKNDEQKHEIERLKLGMRTVIEDIHGYQSRARAWKQAARRWERVTYRHHINAELVLRGHFASFGRNGNMIRLTKPAAGWRDRGEKIK